MASESTDFQFARRAALVQAVASLDAAAAAILSDSGAAATSHKPAGSEATTMDVDSDEGRLGRIGALASVSAGEDRSESAVSKGGTAPEQEFRSAAAAVVLEATALDVEGSGGGLYNAAPTAAPSSSSALAALSTIASAAPCALAALHSFAWAQRASCGVTVSSQQAVLPGEAADEPASAAQDGIPEGGSVHAGAESGGP